MKIDAERLQKQIGLAQSYLNFATNGLGGDKELMMKLAELNTEEINSTVIKLLKVDRQSLMDSMTRARAWIDYLNTILVQTQPS